MQRTAFGKLDEVPGLELLRLARVTARKEKVRIVEKSDKAEGAHAGM